MRRNSKGFSARLGPKYRLDISRIVFLASIILIVFLIVLYTSCAYPGLFGLRYTKIPEGREHIDTYSRDVRQLSPESAAALKMSIQSLSTLGKDYNANLTAGNPSAAAGQDHKSDPQQQLRAAPDASNQDGSQTEDKVKDMRFVVQMHGFQCLVHTLRARKFEPDGLGDITWVTQLTTDRLPIFKRMLERWHGPVSAALYSQNLEADLREIAPLRDRVDFHLVGASQGLYPVNTLRNVALNNCRTDYLILADVDFVPSNGIYEYVKAKLPEWRQDPKSVYVFPAFEIDGLPQDVPESKAALKAMGSRIHQVHNDKGRDIAHKYVNYAKWLTTTDVYQADYNFPFEPYFLAPRTIPRYDVRFFGYGNDKASHCYELNAAGFKFMVAPEAFVVHVQHAQGSWVQASFVDPKDRLNKALTTFLADVDRRYIKRVSTNENLVFPALPPSQLYEALPTKLGESCLAACAEKGKFCRPEWAERINMCKELEKSFTCTYGCNDNFFGSDLPAFNTEREQCLINSAPVANPFSCEAVYVYSRRLCPCGAKA
mmetsp:Transcript_50615/g.105733  ORF Transcript_50615/g.105733 Transcript_50615/m.105733 type:complete len:543 (-) Transcript_50615:13-1641(-)